MGACEPAGRGEGGVAWRVGGPRVSAGGKDTSPRFRLGGGARFPFRSLALGTGPSGWR